MFDFKNRLQNNKKISSLRNNYINFRLGIKSSMICGIE
jgi:hypothetical protein